MARMVTVAIIMPDILKRNTNLVKKNLLRGWKKHIRGISTINK
jgi:hypothetical protein